MIKTTSALEHGAHLDEAKLAYLDCHPLDHDDDIAVEREAAVFDDLNKD